MKVADGVQTGREERSSCKLKKGFAVGAVERRGAKERLTLLLLLIFWWRQFWCGDEIEDDGGKFGHGVPPEINNSNTTCECAPCILSVRIRILYCIPGTYVWVIYEVTFEF